MKESLASLLPTLIVHAVALALVAATLVLVGQPIFANDTWIHLALGEAFASAGPWLDADPYLFAAPGPPSPSSWLGSVVIFAVYDQLGFAGLRVFHALVVASLLLMVWLVIRSATRSATLGSVGVVFFVLLATYRIVQLRPHLMTIGAVLALYLLVFAPREGPSRRGIAAATALTVVWANVHAAFLLGPVLVLGAAMSLFALSWASSVLPGFAVDSLDRSRAGRIGLAGLAMLCASLLNPQGWDAHLAYFSAGQDTLALTAVLDEWGTTNLLAWPAERLPPTPAAWWTTWLCVVGLVAGSMSLVAERRAGRRADPELPEPIVIDPALLALSVASVAAALMASRFLWLGIFPLALLGCVVLRRISMGRGPMILAWGLVGLVAVGAVAHFRRGDWPLVSRALGSTGARYTEPYRAGKFYGHAMWFLADTGVEGRIFNDYPLGGFMSFWLSPALRMSSSGTMNVEREAMEASLAVTARQTVRPDESFAELLDRQGYDLFLGTGLPVVPPASRPIGSTVRHLESEPGWIQVFRSLRSAVYLRRGDRNAENLDRIAAYYAAAGVPFDREDGFDVEKVIVEAPGWATEQGIVPVDFGEILERGREAARRNRLDPEMERLAMLYTVLGLYDRAVALDRRILQVDRLHADSAQRIIWSLLHQLRGQDALEVAKRLDDGPLGRGQAGGWTSSVESFLEGSEAERAAKLGSLPLLSVGQGRWVQLGIMPPLSRASRTR